MSDHDAPTGPDEPMPGVDDDLPPELVRALRAPGSPSELEDEARFVAAFRAQQAAPAGGAAPTGRGVVRRLGLRRLGTGGTAVVVAVALTGGVAAAYTGRLPDPVQQLAHEVIGAPAPVTDAPAPDAGDPREPDPSPSAAPSSDEASTAPSSSPSGSPSRGSDTQGDEPSGPASPSRTPATGPSPSGSPSPSDQPSRSPEPSPSPTPVVDPPAAMTMVGSDHLVGYGATVTLSGRMTTVSGAPAADVRVVLLVQSGGGWAPVAATRTDASGGVGVSSQPVTGLQRYRWRAKHGVRSIAWKVRVKPELAASADQGTTTSTIAVSTVGAQPGDVVELWTRVGGKAAQVAQTSVTAGGTASFEVPTPRRPRVFVVRLGPTRDHAAAKAKVSVG